MFNLFWLIGYFQIYLLSKDKGSLGLSKFSAYKQRVEQKKNPTTEEPLEYSGPPVLDVHWNGHPNLPEELNNAEILKEVMEKVAEYKRYEYCPYGKQMDNCASRPVNEIVDRIIDVVLHPTEPPTEPPKKHSGTSEAPKEFDEESNGTDGGEEEEEKEGTEGEEKTADTTEEAEEGEKTNSGEDSSSKAPEGDDGEQTEAPTEGPAED